MSFRKDQLLHLLYAGSKYDARLVLQVNKKKNMLAKISKNFQEYFLLNRLLLKYGR